MNCAPINLTKEEVRNARKNQSVISGPSINQTAEETIEKLRALKNAVKKIEEVYYVAGEKIKKRVSEVAKRKKKLRAESITPDNEIQRQGGTHIHDIMANLVDFHINGVGNLKEIQDKALVNGPVKLNGKHFDSLNKLALKIKKDVEEQQKKIDPKGKATVLTEAFMADFIKDIGGTEDIVVVFSDNTGWLYDYKTSGRNDPINSQGQVQHNPLPYRDLDAYNLSQAEYKRIMEEKIGIKYIRQNRLIPIAVNYKKKPVNERTKTDSLIPEVNYLATVIDDMETLRSIPAGGEKSQWEGINKIIEKQYGLIKKLNSQLKNRNLTKDQKEHLIERISRIEKSINSSSILLNNIITKPQVTLLKWIMHPVISTRGIDYLSKNTLVRLLGIMEAVLWHRGFHYLAVLGSSYQPTGDVMTVSIVDKISKVNVNLIKEINIQYKYVYLQARTEKNR